MKQTEVVGHLERRLAGVHLTLQTRRCGRVSSRPLWRTRRYGRLGRDNDR